MVILLEGEGVLIDLVGVILVVVVLEIIFNINVSVEIDIIEIVMGLILCFGVGLAIGVGGGWLLSNFFKWVSFFLEDVSNLVVLVGVWGVFGVV